MRVRQQVVGWQRVRAGRVVGDKEGAGKTAGGKVAAGRSRQGDRGQVVFNCVRQDCSSV